MGAFRYIDISDYIYIYIWIGLVGRMVANIYIYINWYKNKFRNPNILNSAAKSQTVNFVLIPLKPKLNINLNYYKIFRWGFLIKSNI